MKMNFPMCTPSVLESIRIQIKRKAALPALLKFTFTLAGCQFLSTALLFSKQSKRYCSSPVANILVHSILNLIQHKSMILETLQQYCNVSAISQVTLQTLQHRYCKFLYCIRNCTKVYSIKKIEKRGALVISNLLYYNKKFHYKPCKNY